jgi:hypothetical protein
VLKEGEDDFLIHIEDLMGIPSFLKSIIEKDQMQLIKGCKEEM